MASVGESVFEFLFKYRPVVFEQGDFAFGASHRVAVATLVGAALAALAILTYARTHPHDARHDAAGGGATGNGSRAASRDTAARGGTGALVRDRLLLGVLRALLIAVALVCLLRPQMVLSAAVSQRNVLGIVLDDSRSMRIADVGGQTRGDFVRRAFARDGALVRELGQRFQLRFFRFASATDRLEDVTELTFSGGGTRIAPAVQRARQELGGLPLAGLVLVTDGADNSRGALADELRVLGARGVPVFAVGVGRESFDRDIQVSRVEIPRSVLKGSTVGVDVVLSQTGFGGRTVPLVVEDAGRIVATQNVTLPRSGAALTVRVPVPVTEAGARLFRFRVPVQEGELTAENNEQGAVVEVRDRRERILYLEGEPRWEMKFVRQAVAGDENVQLVTLQRTAQDKFLRLGVNDSLELVAGFPKTRQELFAYRAVVLGSIEASFFTLDQLRMLSDFVSERGGTLLVLGGRSAFGEGGYAGTPLADVLPVEIENAPEGGKPFFSELAVSPTVAGASHAVTQIPDAQGGAKWKTLPALSTVNRIGRPKPGATVLLEGADPKGGVRQPVLVYQRYGRGMAIALGVQDSWVWQMSVPLEDQTHEVFWRQMLRWLVSDVPERVTVSLSADRIEPNEPIEIRADVRDSLYIKANGARVVAHVTGPSGTVHDVPMEWAPTADGEYAAAFTPDARGMYQVHVDAQLTPAAGRGAGELIGAPFPAVVEAADLRTEFFDAQMRAPLLERVARETGGRFYTPATLDALPKDVVYTKSGTTALERMDLWDMPAVFLLLVLLVAAEWGYRRMRGLA